MHISVAGIFLYGNVLKTTKLMTQDNKNIILNFQPKNNAKITVPWIDPYVAHRTLGIH